MSYHKLFFFNLQLPSKDKSNVTSKWMLKKQTFYFDRIMGSCEVNLYILLSAALTGCNAPTDVLDTEYVKYVCDFMSA